MIGDEVDFFDIIERCVALQKEAMLDYTGVDRGLEINTYPYFFGPRKSPCFLNRVGQIEITDDSEDIDRYSFSVVMRLVWGPVTGGETGEFEEGLTRRLAPFIKFFNQHDKLQSKTFESDAIGIDSARIANLPGVIVFPGTNIETAEYGTEFILRVITRDCLGMEYGGTRY